MTDILKDTLAYHWMTDDAREEGLEQGLARGREEGREEGLCLALMSIIDARFPTVKRLAHNQLASIKYVVPLTKLVTNISLAQSAPEVKQYLLEALEESLELEEGV
jgi:flagellar biosynthesis/type III secretory pathway protein FliH